jgi:hypothetical protein
MKNYRIFKMLQIVVCIALAIAAFGYVVMHLWNWLMPSIFGLQTLSFTQALGLLVLSKLLFGGIHRHAGGRGWKRHMEQRFANMTPEDRERFRSGMRGRRGCGFGPPADTNSAQTPAQTSV